MVLHRRDLWSAVCEVLPLFLVTDYSAPRGLVLRSQLSILFSELIESFFFAPPQIRNWNCSQLNASSATQLFLRM